MKGFMTARGYKNIAEKYYQNTGLRHFKTQLIIGGINLRGYIAFGCS
uniref:Uncharacterized protein n=1 Tax=Arundo donax TaxID=35708 RepID=A0A0A8YGW0_ARUDO